jgi:hypothetical protein
MVHDEQKAYKKKADKKTNASANVQHNNTNKVHMTREQMLGEEYQMPKATGRREGIKHMYVLAPVESSRTSNKSEP